MMRVSTRTRYGLRALGALAQAHGHGPLSLRAIAEQNGLPGLSMGMSGDFEAAIAEGATHVRIGSAIFGDRPPFAGPAV